MIVGIKILVNGNAYRFATESAYITEKIGGTEYTNPYVPYVIDYSSFRSEIKFEGEPPVPNFRFNIWDGHGELRQEFEKVDFEAAKATVLFVDDDGETSQFKGYITEPDYDLGMVELTVKMQEDRGVNTILEKFTHDTFQYHTLINPHDVTLDGNWEVHEDNSWTVFKTAKRSGQVLGTVEPGDTSIKVLIERYKHDTNPNKYEDVDIGTYLDGPAQDRLSFLPATVTGGFDQIVSETYDWSTEYSTVSHVLVVGTELNDGVYTVATSSSSAISLSEHIETGETSDFLGFEQNVRGAMIVKIDLFEAFDSVGGYIILGETGSQVMEDVGAGDFNWTQSKAEIVHYSSVSIEQYDYASGLYVVSLDGVDTTGDYKIKHEHASGESVMQQGALDKIWVDTNGFIPEYSSSDPNLAVGFLWAGKTASFASDGLRLEQDPGGDEALFKPGKTYRAFHRYKISSVITLNYVEDTKTFIELEIHNSPLNSSHIYAADLWNLKSPVDYYEPGTKCQLADFYWTVSKMKLNMENLDEAFRRSSFNPVFFSGRLRGSRVDVLNSFTDLKRVYRESQIDPDNANQTVKQNEDLINNATGQFAVVVDSEIQEYGAPGETALGPFEIIKFYTNERSAALVTDSDEYAVGASVEDAGVTHINTTEEDKVYSNYLRFDVNYYTMSDQSGDSDLRRQEARDFFLSRKYRLIFDPVPENSQDLGKNFPIVYGHVERVPMLQVISRKVLKSDEITAGDDVYIYASHSVDVRLPSDIRIELLDPQNNNQKDFSKKEGLKTSLITHEIQSPFPLVAHKHYTADVQQSVYSDNKIVHLSPAELYNPYHELKKVKSLDGKIYYGVQLTGGEWDPLAGSFDARYPIRNGVGSSTLYATFPGYVDYKGRLIQHPMDIIKHFYQTHGVYPYTEEMFDDDNIEYVKSLTRGYKASIYLVDDLNITDFISRVCKQFAIYWYLKDGKIKFTTADTSVVDHTKPLSEKLNIFNEVKMSDSGSSNVINRVVYEYKKNWVTNSFDGVIDLNPSNNIHCARADKAIGSKSSIKIEADFVNSAAVANRVARLIASRVANHVIEYQCSAKKGTGFEPGDYIPVTYSPLGLNKTPMLVTSVEEEMDKVNLKLVRFMNPAGLQS